MAIALEDRIRRAIELASVRGPVWLSQRARAALALCEAESSLAARCTVDASAAVSAVVLLSSAAVCGDGSGDEAPTGAAVFGVLDDEGTLVSALASATAPSVRAIHALICRRGMLACDGESFLILEVEDGVSAREVQLEYAVSMRADERLTAFV